MEKSQSNKDLCKKALINSIYKKSLENNDDVVLERFDIKSGLSENDHIIINDKKLLTNNLHKLKCNHRLRRVGQVKRLKNKFKILFN